MAWTEGRFFSCPKDYLSNAADAEYGCAKDTVVPVKLQFTLSADKKSFELTYVDPFNSRDGALRYIYR